MSPIRFSQPGGFQQFKKPKGMPAPNSGQQRCPQEASLVGDGAWLRLRVPRLMSGQRYSVWHSECSGAGSASLALFLLFPKSSSCPSHATLALPSPSIFQPLYLCSHLVSSPWNAFSTALLSNLASASRALCLPGQQRLFPLTHPSFTYHQTVLLINYSARPVTSFGVSC